MKKVLQPGLTLYYTGFFPFFAPSSKKNLAILGLGGNIGNVQRRFKKLALKLLNHPKVRLVGTAPILKNPPFGYVDQPDFYNTLIAVETTLSPRELLNFVLYLEQRHKRVRTFKNAPRTLDIDIIFYGNRVVKQKDLTIPHPHWHRRESVIIPLKFLMERL